jgi:gas vesicle protein
MTHLNLTAAEAITMAEQNQTGNQHGSTASQTPARAKSDEAAASTKSLSEQAMSVGKDLSGKAKDFAESSTDALKDHASDLVDAAKEVASQASEKLKDAVNDHKSSGADYVSSLADTMRRAAREFDSDLPIAGSYIRKAASQVEGVSDGIRTGNFNDLVRNAQAFARRQPTAFLGVACLAGFGAVRFLKSSSEGGSSQSGESNVARQSETGTRSGNQGYRDDFSN